jgi:UDP-N-acetyl-D-mannosaminuronic acid transferase (WecB/TagA/CpsF family)
VDLTGSLIKRCAKEWVGTKIVSASKANNVMQYGSPSANIEVDFDGFFTNNLNVKPQEMNGD